MLRPHSNMADRRWFYRNNIRRRKIIIREKFPSPGRDTNPQPIACRATIHEFHQIPFSPFRQRACVYSNLNNSTQQPKNTWDASMLFDKCIRRVKIAFFVKSSHDMFKSHFLHFKGRCWRRVWRRNWAKSSSCSSHKGSLLLFQVEFRVLGVCESRVL